MLLRRFGYTVFGDHDDEIAIQCEPSEPPFHLDLCAVSGQRIIVVEIDGYKGHSSQRAIRYDAHRTNAIKRKLSGKPEVYRFGFWQLKDTPDELIIEELKLGKE